ncbi:PREDICTED: melanoma-associated antigen 10-like [Chrysochloris asiatica]|uniref:Melanoma-associated antigen 10-like n=1 Tax=Chrysochloris asiatica TaxID=185453 RepID=A0A9B0U9H7_CHRAS|nr:PREDICTED: melanoma-associated antigen 10-like [Chrysochloris asiatica]
MSPPSKRRRYSLEQSLHPQSEHQSQEEEAQVFLAEEEEVSSSSTSSSCFPLSSRSSSPSCSLLPSTPESVSATGSPFNSQSPQISYSPSQAIAAPCVSSNLDEGSSSQEDEGQGILQASPDYEAMLRQALDDKVTDVVQFLLLKYQMKELTTRAEILTIIREYQDHFSVIFRETAECMQLVFGIDMKEVDPSSHSYALVNTLGLTYDGMLSGDYGVPKTGILILVLSIIFLEGNCAPEENIWKALSTIGVYAGREHSVYGDLQKLITNDWVQEGYLEYWPVPNSHPTRYEFRWGPRAHAETNKMKVLEFWAKICDSDPRNYPFWYEEALRDLAERAQSSVATEITTAMSIESFPGPHPAASSQSPVSGHPSHSV